MTAKKYESNIADEVYDKLFDNTKYQDLDFRDTFPDAEVDYGNARIYLGDFVIKIERVSP
jgi:hypothetical protein